MAILGYLAIAFKIWMVIDALRRGVGFLWFAAVLLVPFGDWLYFLAVKLRDYNVRPAQDPQAAPQHDLERMRRTVRESPSFANRIALAWALLDEGEATEARDYFELALSTHAHDREALQGLGLCQLATGDHAAAVETLSDLVDQSLAYDDYRAAMALVEALFHSGQDEAGFELLARVVRASHRVDHQVALAQYQLRAQKLAEARETLRAAIDAFESLPDFLRRRNGASATEARRLLRTLE